jgi:recombinational DNA repair protein RecT
MTRKDALQERARPFERNIYPKHLSAFQVGYKGWKALALQSGNIAYIQAHEVYDADEFAFEYGTGAYLKHRPGKENNGVMSHFYALAKLVNGFDAFEVITIQDAEKSRRNSETQYEWIGDGRNKVKKYSETPKDVWGKYYAQMALRVPVKRLCASLPLTPAIENAMREDGGITYVNSDGKVIFTPPADVEKQADESSPVEEAETLPEKYFTIKEEVQSLDFESYCQYFEGFVGSDIFKISKETREMVVEIGMRKVQSIEQLARVFNMLPGISQKDVSLKSFFTKKKTQLT